MVIEDLEHSEDSLSDCSTFGQFLNKEIFGWSLNVLGVIICKKFIGKMHFSFIIGFLHDCVVPVCTTVKKFKLLLSTATPE